MNLIFVGVGENMIYGVIILVNDNINSGSSFAFYSPCRTMQVDFQKY